MAPAPLVLFRGATKSPALMPLIDEEFTSEVLARVNVVGTSGSGKSTFARLLASKLELPVMEMDALYWDRNWSEPSDEVFFTRLRAALAQPRWVLDGNYDRTLPIKWQAATTVIWLITLCRGHSSKACSGRYCERGRKRNSGPVPAIESRFA